MAGKFVSIEEAARLLGESVEEVNRLVDRKKLFPMRDGAALKFKVEEIERVAASLGDDSSRSDSLTLDLDLPTPTADDLAIGNVIDIGDVGPGGKADAGSQTLVRGDADAGGLSGLALDMDDGKSTDSDDLSLESIIGASSPSLVRAPGGSEPLGITAADSGPLALDASNVVAGGSAAAPGSQATGSSGRLTGVPGSGGFTVPADSGLSLDDGGIGISGIDLSVPNASGIAASGIGASGIGVSNVGGPPADDAFELGADLGDEESASVVIATEESGDSSFFANVAGESEDSASVQFEDSSIAAESSSASLLGVDAYAQPAEMGFNGWQLTGLTCCALFLLAGAFVMYEVAWTIRTPAGVPASAPLLDGLSATFGWKN